MRKSNYDKSPSTTVDGALWKGWESVLDKLKDVCNVPEELARKVVVIECYHGVYPEELAEHLATLHPSLMIHSDQCFKGVEVKSLIIDEAINIVNITPTILFS